MSPPADLSSPPPPSSNPALHMDIDSVPSTNAPGFRDESQLFSDDTQRQATDVEGDDALANATRLRNITLATAIPKVTDETAEKAGQSFEKFLEAFKVDVVQAGSTVAYHLYVEKLRHMAAANAEVAEKGESAGTYRNILYVDFAHLYNTDPVLGNAVQYQYYRVESYLKRALHAVVRRNLPAKLWSSGSSSIGGLSLTSTGSAPQPHDYTIAFHSMLSVHRLRQLRTVHIGRLISISGTVTRTSTTHPQLHLAKFRCQACASAYPTAIEQQFVYTVPPICQNPACGNRKDWDLDTDASEFIDWQKVRVQENSGEVPAGAMPRSIEVIVRGEELVERARPGDRCLFTGALVVVPDTSMMMKGVGAGVESRRDGGGRSGGGRDGATGGGVSGFRGLGVRELGYRLAFIATTVQPAEQKYSTSDDIDSHAGIVRAEALDPSDAMDAAQNGEENREHLLETFAEEEIADLKAMIGQQGSIYGKLVNSLAPTVFGHEDVKKGILLQLMGGVHKQTTEGINLRGDINVCIVGDPSTSKSQFLRYVCQIVPRSVFTSGKASSAAGLTASVVKDEETGEFTIEAGALMLADNGICAIDEFDKMDVVDQVAIHEAMEQQTISIAKAGIHATLNARASILAAANPVGGRYDKKLTLKQNINISAPIMSRFDLFFIVLDDCNPATDYNVARHIVRLHQHKAEAIQPEFTTEQLRRYIRFARTFKPKMNAKSRDLLRDLYRQLRQSDTFGVNRTAYRITVRQLESLIRLSEALARVHCDDEVKPAYVREAFKLLQKSIIHVERDDVDLSDEDDEDANHIGSRAVDILEDVQAQRAVQQHDGAMDVDDTASTIVQPPVASTGPSGKLRIDRDTYERVRDAMVLYLRQAEEIGTDGIRKSELIDWYMTQQDDADMGGRDWETGARRMIEKIIAHLVKKDGVLIELRDVDRISGGGEAESSTMASSIVGDPVLMVHPNFVLDE